VPIAILFASDGIAIYSGWKGKPYGPRGSHMPIDTSRRWLAGSLMTMPVWPACAAPIRRDMASILDFGARPDGQTINSAAIQATIDAVAAKGGGTVLVPPGTFVSGALFLKPGVHLHLAAGAVLKCTLDMTHFPPRPTPPISRTSASRAPGSP
jgi:alpha-L-rhamnosidase